MKDQVTEMAGAIALFSKEIAEDIEKNEHSFDHEQLCIFYGYLSGINNSLEILAEKIYDKIHFRYKVKSGE